MIVDLGVIYRRDLLSHRVDMDLSHLFPWPVLIGSFITYAYLQVSTRVLSYAGRGRE